MEALTGCTRDELIGAPFKNYFTDPERAEAGIKLVLREKKVTNYELTARARDGKTTVVSYNATTFYDRDRKLQGVFAAARDVTERKRLDQALQEQNVELKRARAAAEKANLAKSDFLSSMSHELRSPLNAILGFAQLMNSDTPPPTPSQTASIDQILHAGWYLLELINEILDLAQIESGKLALSSEPTSLAEVMVECQAMIEPQGQKRGISMTFPRVRPPLLRGCRSDPLEAGSHQPSFQRDQVQPAEWHRRGRGGLCQEQPGTRSHQRQGHRRGTASGDAGAAVSAVQPPRTRAQRRGRYRHRPGDEQAAGGTDGRRDRRGEHGRVGERVLVRTERGRRAAT